MPVSLQQFFNSANTVGDSASLFLQNGGESVGDTSSLHGIHKLSRSAKAEENRATVTAFLNALDQSPQFRNINADIRGMLNAKLEGGKPLTAEDVKLVRDSVLYEDVYKRQVNDRYPGSAINVLQGASVSNPLRLEQNAADVTLTQTFNTVAARDGKAPYKKPLKNVASLANMNDTSRLSIIVSADLPVNTFDELMEKKLPVRLDRGAKGTLHNVVGAMLLAEYGYTYDDITKWGGAHLSLIHI